MLGFNHGNTKHAVIYNPENFSDLLDAVHAVIRQSQTKAAVVIYNGELLVIRETQVQSEVNGRQITKFKVQITLPCSRKTNEAIIAPLSAISAIDIDDDWKIKLTLLTADSDIRQVSQADKNTARLLMRELNCANV